MSCKSLSPYERILRVPMRKVAAAIVIGCSLAFAGCNSLRYAPAGDEAAAKRFAPVKGKAVVYLYRDADKNPDYVPLQFCRNCNARSRQEHVVEPAGWLFSNTFVRWEMEPGVHEILIFYPIHIEANTYALPLGVAADEVYFFKVTPEPRIFRALDLEGKLVVQHCRLLRNELRGN
jgi:hypothetical protein